MYIGFHYSMIIGDKREEKQWLIMIKQLNNMNILTICMIEIKCALNHNMIITDKRKINNKLM